MPFKKKKMQIIDELINKISEGKISLTDILIQTKVLAFQLKNDELKTWINNELNGYEDVDTLPSYRTLSCEITGTISNGYRRATNYPIPLLGIDEDLKEIIKTINLYQSISAIDSLVKEGKNSKMSINVSADFYQYLSQDFDNGYQIEYARKEISSSQIVQVLTSVKSKLLDFLLELNEAFGEESIKNLSEGKEKDEVSSLFKSAVFGNNTTIIVGDGNSQKVTIKDVLFKNFDELSRYFESNQMPKESISELATIIDSDNQNIETKEFGDKVKGWVSKTITKAMDGSWTVGLAAAGKVLADGVSRYYGWK